MRTCAIPERFCGGDSLRRGAISSVCTFTFLPLQWRNPLAAVTLIYLHRPQGSSP